MDLYEIGIEEEQIISEQLEDEFIKQIEQEIIVFKDDPPAELTDDELISQFNK